MTEPLSPNPTRQAVEALAGYVYQLWQSLYRWSGLRDDEVLYLEGAEDLDVLRLNSAETVQVKTSVKPITLASSDVLKAIGEWWENQKRNPALVISLSFLTRAPIGLERDRPFGEQRGLEYWELCRTSGIDPTPLRTYLAGQQSLPADLLELLRQGTDDELRTKVLKPISWCTSAPPQATVEELVKDRVVAYGERVHNLPPSQTIPLVAQFFEHVANVALRRTDRRLTKRMFAELFQQRTSTTISHAEHERLRRADARLRELTASQDPGLVLESAQLAVAHVPKPSAQCVRRDSLINALAAQLGRTGLLVLTGSAGMGKSTLARALVDNLDTQWRLLDLRGQSPGAMAAMLRREALEIGGTGVGGLLVDDINLSERPEACERALAMLLTAARMASYPIILTTQGAVPVSILLELGTTPEAVTVSAPPLVQKEIAELLNLCDCPAPSVESFASLIHVTTSGHPLLAHARARRLREYGWPSLGEAVIASLFTRGDDLAEVQRQARHRLQDDVPSAEARTFVYRLSVFTKYFRREHALSLAATPAAGELFERLLGPWIEAHQGGYYCLSPLLAGAGRELLPPADLQAAQRAACDALLAVRTFTPLEFSQLLALSLGARYARGLLMSYVVASQVPPNLEKQFLEQVDWLLLLAPGSSELLFSEDPIVSVLLRELQFRVASAMEPSVAAMAHSAWERELDLLEARVPAPLAAAWRLMFLIRSLFAPGPPLPAATVVRCLAGAFRLLADQPDLAQALPSLRGHQTLSGWREDLLAEAIWRQRGRSAVASFLEEISQLPEADGRAVLGHLAAGTQQPWDLAMAALAGALEAGQQAWGEVHAIAVALRRLGERYGMRALAVSGYRLQAVIQAEYERSPERALATLHEAASRLEGTEPFLEECRARVLAASGRDQEALAIWLRLLPTWTAHDTTWAFSYRAAGMAAGRLGQHDVSATLFMTGAKLADQFHLGIMGIGLAGDAAVALVKAGRLSEAVTAFAALVSRLTSGLHEPTSLETIVLWRYAHRALAWASRGVTRARGASARPMLDPPEPGRLSEYASNDPFEDAPAPLPRHLWALLVQLEGAIEGESSSLRDYRARFPDDPPSAVALESMVAMLSIQRGLRLGRFAGMATKARTLFRNADGAVVISDRPVQAIPTAAAPGVTPVDLAMCLLSVTVLIVVARELDVADAHEQWRGEIETAGLGAPGDAWLRFVLGPPSTDAVWRIVADPDASRAMRLAAAALLVATGDAALKRLGVASTLLVTCYSRDPWRDDVEHDLESLLSRTWLRIAEEQRFNLVAPSRSCPALASACNDVQRTGIGKSARIVLRAAEAIGWAMPREQEMLLGDLAAGEMEA